MFVYANSADDELLPVNNEDTGSAPETHNRNFKREAMLVSILMDMMDKFYVSRKMYTKRSQYEEVVERDKSGDE